MKLKVLIVEDDKYSYLLLTNYLRIVQADIVWAKTGHEALQIFKSNTDWDLVFMDITLPDINGYVVTQKIRKVNSNVKIIAETANALYGDRDKSLQSGCNDYLSKPIQKEQFYTTLKKLRMDIAQPVPTIH